MSGSETSCANAVRPTREELEALGEEIATFAARIDVARHALLTRPRNFDAHEAWGPMGFTSTAHWLAWRTGVDIKTAREQVRVAAATGNALAELERFLQDAELHLEPSVNGAKWDGRRMDLVESVAWMLMAIAPRRVAACSD